MRLLLCVRREAAPAPLDQPGSLSQELTAANVAEVRLAEELLAEANLGIGVAALHVEHPLDHKRRVVGPVNHTVTQPARDILGASTRLIVIPGSRLPKPGRG